MALRKITEQQFLSRRKDRRMMWVDLGAALVGLLLLSMSVAGVIVLEEEPEPFQWSVSYFEGKVTQKRCAGGDPSRVGCSFVYFGEEAPPGRRPGDSANQRGAPEGYRLAAGLEEVFSANITRVSFKLDWIDDTPEDAEDRTYVYDENATDLMLLEVTTPWGETHQISGRNGLPEGDRPPTGQLRVDFPFVTVPTVTKTEGFTEFEVQSRLAADLTVNQSDAHGRWGVFVTLVEAGDQQGTLPPSACEGQVADQNYTVPGEVRETVPPERQNLYDQGCNLEDDQGELEKQPLPRDQYEATYIDNWNEWVLEMVVWTYSTTVSI